MSSPWSLVQCDETRTRLLFLFSPSSFSLISPDTEVTEDQEGRRVCVCVCEMSEGQKGETQTEAKCQCWMEPESGEREKSIALSSFFSLRVLCSISLPLFSHFRSTD